MEIKKFSIGDVLLMKKPHPCSKTAVRFAVLTLGSDVKVRCLNCGREVVVQRVKLEKNIKNTETNQ